MLAMCRPSLSYEADPRGEKEQPSSPPLSTFFEYLSVTPKARLLKVSEDAPTILEKMQEAPSSRRLQLRYLAGPYNNVEFKYLSKIIYKNIE